MVPPLFICLKSGVVRMAQAYSLVSHAMTVAAFAALIRQGYTKEQIIRSCIVPAIT